VRYLELLAEATQTTDPAANGAGGTMFRMLGYMAIFFFIFWFIVFRPRKHEQRQREQMLKQLKKHDKVVTIGGMIGTVMEVRDDEVIVKIDDSSNTRVKFIRGSIQRVVNPAEDDKSSKSQ